MLSLAESMGLVMPAMIVPIRARKKRAAPPPRIVADVMRVSAPKSGCRPKLSVTQGLQALAGTDERDDADSSTDLYTYKSHMLPVSAADEGFHTSLYPTDADGGTNY